MFCYKCGKELDDNTKFCDRCGTELNFPRVQSEPAEPTVSATVSEAETVSRESVSSAAEVIRQPSVKGTESPIPGISMEDIEKAKRRKRRASVLFKIFFGGLIAAATGVTLFISIVAISLIGWGKVYLFDGYDFTEVLATVSMILMISGFTLCLGIFIASLIARCGLFKKRKVAMIVISSVLAALCIGFSIWGFIDYDDANSSNNYYSGGGSYGGSYNNNYNSGVDKSIGLSLKVDSIKTSGSYTYVYCSVTNVSSRYVATRYRYVKVKAAFKNYSGSIVDTDWTYAVDSTWLEPGETKTFYYMVKNTNIRSATLSFAS